MQFSVVVEGAIDGKVPGEESLAELQRYLRSTSSPQQLIQRLNSGKPFVIKKSLGYEQAVTISDRLFDFGLETFIDPPAKPDANKPHVNEPLTNEKVVVQKVSVLNQGIHPQKQSTSPVAQQKVLGGGTVDGRTVRTNAKSQSPIKAAVHTGNLAKTVLHKNNIHTLGSKPATASPLKSAAAPAAKQSAASVAKAVPAQTTKTKPQTNAVLAKAASEIKSLFRGPQPLAMSIPNSAYTRLLVACVGSALLPVAYASALIAVVGLTMAVLIAGGGYLSNWSFIVPLVLLPVPVFMLIGVTAIIALPLLSARSKAPDRITLQARDEPKLFMFVAALAKLAQATPPATIDVVAEPVLRCRQTVSLKDFLSVRQNLPEKTHLTIGAPLLYSLSVKEFGALAAAEFSQLSAKSLQRPYALGCWCVDFLSRAKYPAAKLSKLLRTVQHRINSQKLSDLLERFIAGVSWLESVINGYFSRAERIAERLIRQQNAGTKTLQSTLAGADTAERIGTTFKNLHLAYRQSREKLLVGNTQRRYVDSLPDLVHQQLQATNKNAGSHNAATGAGMISVDRPMRNLVDSLRSLNRTTTTGFYELHDLDPSTLDIYSLEELMLKKVEDSRLQKIANQYYCRWFNQELRWKLPNESTLQELDRHSAINRLNQCVSRIRYMSPDRINGVAAYAKMTKQIVELRAARKILASGNEYKFQHCTDLSSDLDQETTSRIERYKVIKHDLHQQNAVMGERIALALVMEQERKSLALGVYKSLVYFSSIDEKLNNLTHDTEELNSILQFSPKKLSRNYELHVKELSERIDEGIKSIVKRAQHCPFQFINKRFASLSELLTNNISIDLTGAPTYQLINKSKILQKSLDRAYKSISEVAADIAADVEKKLGIETVKRI